jgi:hypothetical protein
MTLANPAGWITSPLTWLETQSRDHLGSRELGHAPAEVIVAAVGCEDVAGGHRVGGSVDQQHLDRVSQLGSEAASGFTPGYPLSLKY